MVPASSSLSAPRKVRPRRVGVLVSHLSDEYEWAIVRGVRAVIEAAQGSVICVAGGSLEDPRPERALRNLLFDLLDESNVDGLVVVSSVIDQFVGSEAMGKWLARFRVPICSVGHVEGFASVEIEDGAGVRELVSHLIEYHGHRRIAFVGGPEANAEAQARVAAYRRALELHEIPYDPRLVTVGEFTWASGRKALRQLLDERQLSIAELDAIVAANDYMAFGVIDELSRRRIAVPDQVAVVGFDDMPRASVHQPTLTTVKQQLDELGREAARLLLARIEGRSSEAIVTLPTELVLRRSCGCVPTDVPAAPEASASEERPPADQRIVPRGGAWSTELVAALVAEASARENAFERALDPLLQRMITAGIDLSLVQDLISFLAQRALRQVGDDERFAQRIESAVQRGRVLVSELTLRSELMPEDSISERLHRFSRALLTRMFDPQALLSAVLVEHLPALGISECLVSELVDPASVKELRAAFGFDDKNLQPRLTPYAGQLLLPAAFEGLLSRSLYVLPARYGEQALGVVLLPVCGHDGSVYETLAEVFGIALKGIEMRRKSEQRLAPGVT